MKRWCFRCKRTEDEAPLLDDVCIYCWKEEALHINNSFANRKKELMDLEDELRKDLQDVEYATSNASFTLGKFIDILGEEWV